MIIECLPKGKENAISTEALCRATGIDNIRMLRAAVAKERKAGEIIASSSKGGYYIPNNAKELEEFVHTLDSKARSIMVALQSARKLLKAADNENQIVIQPDKFTKNWTGWGDEAV